MAPIGSKWYHWIAETSLPNFYRQALALAVMLAGNIVGLRLRAHSWVEVQKRAGSMAVINLVPLCTGISFGLPADLLHVDRQMLAWFHRWAGRICAIHSLLHCSLLVTIARTMNLASSQHVVPLVAGCALVLVVPVTCAAVQRRHLQFALKSHYLLAATGIGALIYHLVERQSLYRWYLVGATCLWFFISAVVCIIALWDQKPWRSSSNEVVMNSVSHFLWLEIDLPLSRAIRPGQCVQLWMPQAGFRAFFQLPRFYVAFWEDGPTQRMVRMVADPEPGLTRRFYHDALTSPARQPVLILGPYGHPFDFYRYGTIIFVVEDIGFFRALSYIEMLVEASRKREVMVRKLEVLWKRQVGKDGMFTWAKEPHLLIEGLLENPQWVNKWMQDLFNRDWRAFKILRFSIYCQRAQSSSEETLSYEHNAMLCYFYGSIKIEDEVARHLDNRCGAMAVAVCAGPPIREAVMKTVRPHTGRDLRLIIFDPDMSPASDSGEPGSVETAVASQASPQEALEAEEDKVVPQVRPFPADNRKLQYSSPIENNTQTGKVKMDNHSKWSGSSASIDTVSAKLSALQRAGNHVFCREFMYHREGAMGDLDPGLLRRTAGSPSRADPFSRGS
ncbi:uncharacterized protein N7511_000858 [Penicillium nucicola]|uniref:uncharacterized protein n=1 Tax=Penicillium nucicola TaxID=1850975 RepID=UPI0025452459|nr:uncharacterized protein N7511_000858 [Penicillium nucicola]KAJ5775847.1 hypothetical protein N7511_000858 [Penicillium nucicola]